MIFETDVVGSIYPQSKSYGGSGELPFKVLEEIQSTMIKKWNGGYLEKFVDLLNDEFAKYDLDYEDFILSDLRIRAYKSDLFFDVTLTTDNNNDDFIQLGFWFETWDGKNYIESYDLDNY